jgi:hypothetical protein
MTRAHSAAGESWGGAIGHQLHSEAQAMVATEAASAEAHARLMTLVATDGERFANEVAASIEVNIAAFNATLATPLVSIFSHFPKAAGLVLRASDRASSWLSVRAQVKPEDHRPGLRVVEQRQSRQLESPHRFVLADNELRIDFYGRELAPAMAAEAIVRPWLMTLEIAS